MMCYRRNRNRTEAYGSKEKLTEYIVQNSTEQNRRVWNTLETTVSYKARARLTPTLTHVVTYELVTSGAEDDAMSVLVTMKSCTDKIMSMLLTWKQGWP